MDLLDRYLEAVKKHLPWQRQDDIIAELKANLEAQLEDKEIEQGRPLTASEMEAWLKELGAPMMVAARYQPQRYLIGPAIFPMYWYVLKIAMFWAFVIYAIVSSVKIFAGDFSNGSAALGAVLQTPGVLLTTAAWVTGIFALVEFGVSRSPSKCGPFAGATSDWSVGTLPLVGADLRAGKKPRSFAQAVAEVVFGFLLLIWLLLFPKNPWLLLGPGALYLRASPYHLAAVWVPFYWCVVALNVFQLAWQCVNLMRGRWQGRQPAQSLAIKTVGLIPIFVLFQAPGHIYASLTNPAVDEALHGAHLAAINHGIYRGVLFGCVIVGLQWLWEIGRISLNSYRKRVAAR